MKTVATLLLIVYAASSYAGKGSYLSCTGHSGQSPKQDLIPLLSRTITVNESPEKGSIFVGDDKVAVEGIPWMLGDYKICENSDQVILFSPGCFPGEPDKLHDFGILNKVTGDVRYHVGDSLFILNCRKAAKILK